MSGVQTREVSTDEAGIRLDRWFRRHFETVSHGRLEKMLRKGEIRVDGGRVKSSTRLEAGQTIRIPPIGEQVTHHKPPRLTKANKAMLEGLKASVIYQDDDVLVVNKPAGLPVQGGSKVTLHLDGLLDGLRFGAKERPKLVHRLDKDTSGVLVLARNSFAATRLAEFFRTRKVEKTYWALVAGRPEMARGEIRTPMEKRRDSEGFEKMESGGGRHAVTRYLIIDQAGHDVSWLALYPETGRTHQLRVHCAEIGTPIIGDRKYGRSEEMPGALMHSDKLHLHARRLVLPHPRNGLLELDAALPDFMQESWKFFEFDLAIGDQAVSPDRDH